MPGKGRAHQGLMSGWTRALDRERELFGDAGVPFPAIFDQAGDSVPGADDLRSDGGEGEVVRKSVTPSDKCIRCPSRPMVSRVKDPVQRGPLAMLDNVREPFMQRLG